MRRTVVPELLDTDSGSPAEVQASLADLRWLNRWFGGISTTTASISRIASAKKLSKLSFLDVAGATGDVARGAVIALQNQGVELDCAVADRAASHLDRQQAAVAADAFHLPFADSSFDVTGSALFIHHLQPEQLTGFLRESLRVCRHACIINDLRRSWPHLLAAQAGRLVYRSPITAHDAPASVRRAYTKAELMSLLKELPVSRIEFFQHFFFRMGVILWK